MKQFLGIKLLFLLICFSSNGQNHLEKEVKIDFQDDFNIDSCVLFLNNICIVNRKMTSDPSIGLAYFKTIKYKNMDTLNFELLFFQKNYEADSNIIKYKKHIEFNFYVVPEIVGRYIGIYIECEDDPNRTAIYHPQYGWICKPSVIVQKEPFLYD